jgi:hypothetical protein
VKNERYGAPEVSETSRRTVLDIALGTQAMREEAKEKMRSCSCGAERQPIADALADFAVKCPRCGAEERLYVG